MPADTVRELVIEDLAAALDRAEVTNAALLDALVDLAARDYHLEQLARESWLRAAHGERQLESAFRQLHALQDQRQARS